MPLEPADLLLICHDEWNTTEEVTAEDEDGNISVVMPASEAGDRHGFRMDQLLAFISIGFDTSLDDIANRLDALLFPNGVNRRRGLGQGLLVTVMVQFRFLYHPS